MDLGIRDRSALVFGGSRGIGRAVAGVLAAEGANVAVCARKEWAAQRVAAEAADRGRVKALGYRLEAGDEASASAQADRIARDFGAIDILFGIARRTLRDEGRGGPGAPPWSARLDDGFLRFRAITETLLAGMQRRRWGRILWMIPWPETRNGAVESVRAVTGAALATWLHCVAEEVAGDNVTLNVLRPPPSWRLPAPAGRTAPEPEAEPGEAAARAWTDPADRGRARAGGALSAGDAAAVAAFLLGDCARGVYGRTVALGAATCVRPCGEGAPAAVTPLPEAAEGGGRARRGGTGSRQ